MEEKSWRSNQGGGLMEEKSWGRIVLEKPGERIVDEEPWRRNHGKGIIAEKAWRRNRGGEMMEEE